MTRFFYKYPCLLGTFGAVSSVASSGAVFFHYIQGVMATVTLIFGFTTAVFTALVAWRRWWRGFKMEHHEKRERRYQRRLGNIRRRKQRDHLRRQ